MRVFTRESDVPNCVSLISEETAPLANGEIVYGIGQFLALMALSGKERRKPLIMPELKGYGILLTSIEIFA